MIVVPRQPLTVDFAEKTMIHNHGVKSPTCKEGWAGKPVEMGPGNRDAWDGDRLETLIKEKLMMRTKSGNGQVGTARRARSRPRGRVSPQRAASHPKPPCREP